jgi:hypothetical protein
VVPSIGPPLAELVGTVMPNQRIERIAKFVEILARRLEELKQDSMRSQITNENCADLMEEGLRQAARSLSDERREYIASLIANGVNSENIEYMESRHLLRILGELNDIEILWLRYYLDPHMVGDHEFREKHNKVLEPVMAPHGSPPSLFDKEALQISYKEHLANLGLLERKYEMDSSAFGTTLEAKSYELTWLGRLMLKVIGLADEELK